MASGDRDTARVDLPRPGAAWLMAIVASASLWITGELDHWIVPVQLACLAVSYWTRSAPPAWRRSPVWLNVGMMAITAVTITKALQGNPATISLAYFASLSQGLQLLDARPRKSEFLLVALALFQVILASNLTDSVFFPPLVLVFVVTVTWTLLIHTLRTEAATAGDLRAMHATAPPDLRRTTAVLSALSILLALGFFMVLPRMKTSMLRGGVGAGLAVSGFSDRVSLGAGGRIHKDRRVVLRVETVAGETPPEGSGYWRGLAFDRFDGRTWSISPGAGQSTRIPVTGIPRFGVSFGDGPAPGSHIERIVREPVEAGVLFGAGSAQRIEGPLQYVERDANGGLYHPAGVDDRVRYMLWTAAPVARDGRLAMDHTAPPREPGWRGRKVGSRYLALPPLDPAIATLARDITAQSTSDLQKLERLEAHLRRQGRYTDDPPERGGAGDGRSPVEAFLLGDLAGHCEYFASAMVVLSRSLGMPARLVNGFAGGRRNGIGGFTELSRADAHAWVEVHFAEAGWVRFDPTPPDMRWQAAGTASLLERFAELGSVLELWWFQRVVDFDSSDQILALRSAFSFGRDLFGRSSPSSGDATVAGSRRRFDASAPDGLVSPPALAICFALLCALALGLRLRGRSTAREITPQYRRALRLLARHRIERAPSTTARAFAARVATELDESTGRAFARLTDFHLARRFGDASGPESQVLEAELAVLRTALRRLPPRGRRDQRAP